MRIPAITSQPSVSIFWSDCALRGLRCNSLRHQVVITIDKAGVAVEAFGVVIGSNYLEMNRTNVIMSRLLFDERKRLFPPATAAVGRQKKEFVDEGITAKKFETVSECKHDVTNGSLGVEHQPGESILGAP